MSRSKLGTALIAVSLAVLIFASHAEESVAHGKNRNPSDISLGQMIRALPPSGRFVLFRSYLPANGRDNVKLPTVTVVENGTRTTLPECPWRETSLRDHFAAEQEFASTDFNIRRVIRIIARIIGLNPSGPAPYCSWWFVVDNETFNIAFPDSHATYWATPFLAQPGTDLEIEGEYGEMRYMSFGIYDQKFNYYEYAAPGGSCELGQDNSLCFGSYITDFQIDPEIPGTNPFQTASGSPAATYKVTITATPESTPGNVLPALSSKSGCLPGQSCNGPDGVSVGAENNPLTLTQGLFPPPCNFPAAPYTCATPNLFVRPIPAIVSSVVSNPDNTYIPAGFDGRAQILPLDLQQPEKVFVLRGKIPKTPLGTQPVAWPNDAFDMRYWSICTAVYFPPYPTVESDDACVADLELNRTNKAGQPKQNGNWFTIILSTKDNKPDIDYEAVGANWLELTNLTRSAVILRNMVPSEGFDQAAQNIPANGSWKSALKTMGNFLPLSSTACNKQHLEENGWGGCVAPNIPNTGGNSDGATSGVGPSL